MSFHNHDPEDPQGFIRGRNAKIRKEKEEVKADKPDFNDYDPMPARPKGQIHEIEIDPSDIIIVKVRIHGKAVSETKIWSESHGIARKSTGEMYHWSDFKHKAVQKEWDDEPLMRY